MAEFVITPPPTEGNLWELLARMVANPEIAKDVHALRLAEWNPDLIYLPDEEMGHSLRPLLARSVLDFHASLSRAYALVVYGQPNRLLLRKEDKEALDILFRVTDGSTGIQAIGRAIERLTEQMVSKLTGGQVMAIVVMIVLLYFGFDLAKEIYANRLEEKREQIASDERIAFSEQETERFRLFKEAMGKFGVASTLKDEAEEGLMALTKPAREQDHSRVRGVDLTKRQARIVLSDRDKAREGKRLDGIYRVIDINTETDVGFVVKLQDVDTEQEITAYATYDELTREDIHTIFQVAENKSVVRALVNAWFVGDRISRAFIVRAYVESDAPD